MKLKKMKKALKNLEKGAVVVSKKDKKYDITECPEKWDDREIIDSYNTEGKNGGITIILGGKSGKKNKDVEEHLNDIDSSIEQMQKDLDNLDSSEDTHSHNNKEHKKDHDHKRDSLVEKKADEIIQNSRKNDSDDRYKHNSRNNDTYRRNRRIHNPRRSINENKSVDTESNTDQKED